MHMYVLYTHTHNCAVTQHLECTVASKCKRKAACLAANESVCANWLLDQQLDGLLSVSVCMLVS